MSKKTLEVWSVREDPSDDQKSYWKHIGVAFENRDGSFNIHLDALPLGRKLQIRAGKAREERN